MTRDAGVPVASPLVDALIRLVGEVSGLRSDVGALTGRIATLEGTVTGCQGARDRATAVAEAERTAEVARADRTWARIREVAGAWPVRYALTGLVGILLLVMVDRCGVDLSRISWGPGGAP